MSLQRIRIAFSGDFFHRQATVVFQMRSRTTWTPALTPLPTWRAMVSDLVSQTLH